MDLKKSQKHLLVAMFNNGVPLNLVRFQKKGKVAFQPWTLEFIPPLRESEKEMYDFLLTSKNPQIKVYVPENKFKDLVNQGLLVWKDNETVALTDLGVEKARRWHNEGYHAFTVR